MPKRGTKLPFDFTYVVRDNHEILNVVAKVWWELRLDSPCPPTISYASLVATLEVADHSARQIYHNAQGYVLSKRRMSNGGGTLNHNQGRGHFSTQLSSNYKPKIQLQLNPQTHQYEPTNPA